MRPLYWPTPLVPAPRRDGVHLKLEPLQPTGSYKVRGYAAAATALPPSELERGLMTVSAGNAAAACAYVASALGVRCRVVMVDSAPAVKVEAVRRWGAEPRFMPRAEMFEWMARKGWESDSEVMIHPHTDPVLGSAAGHGTVVAEVVDQLSEQLRRLVVPVGGGGLVLGVADALRVLGLRDRVTVVGAVSAGYPLWTAAIAAGGPPAPPLVADTVSDGTVAPFNPDVFPKVRAAVDEWVVVPEADIRAGMGELARDVHVVAEGSGALAFGALRSLTDVAGTVCLVTGGNTRPEALAAVLDFD